MKTGLRTQFRAARDALGAKARSEAAAAIERRLGELRPYEKARHVLFYASFGSEVSTIHMIEAARAQGRQVLLPRTEGRTLVLHRYEPGDVLVANRWGIPEPPAGKEPVELSAADVVIVPGLAFDRRGHRLGYGGGYYDRLLRTSPHAYRIGLSYAILMVERLPTLGHDEPVDAVVTDSDVYVYPRSHH